VQELAKQLNGALSRSTAVDVLSWIQAPLLSLLARGEPVAVEDIAAATGKPVETVSRLLPTLPSIELDTDGRVIGAGITLHPTQHRFEVGGKQLYTWCALDTLVFPAIIGQPAHITSPCRTTGAPVRLTVKPDAVSAIDPPTAVVSIVTPSDVSNVRSAFCSNIHFFSSQEAASPWLDQHPTATVLPVTAAFDLGRHLRTAQFARPANSQCC
jgi:alkylmercury lyase